MKCFLRKIVILIIMLLIYFLSVFSNFAAGEAIGSLSTDQLINKLKGGFAQLTLAETKKIWIEIFKRGDEAVPNLISEFKAGLGSKEELIKRFKYVFQPLKLTGGSEEARKLLKSYPEDIEINWMKSALCFGLAALSDPDCESRFHLTPGRGYHRDVPYALAISRDKRYLSMLEKFAESDPDVRHQDVRYAIYWINVGPSPLKKGQNDIQRIRQLIFEFIYFGGSKIGPGVETLNFILKGEEAQIFYGSDGRLYSALPKEDSPIITTFEEVNFNNNKTKAYTTMDIASVKSVARYATGKTYDFLLEKRQGGWQFTAIWVSVEYYE